MSKNASLGLKYHLEFCLEMIYIVHISLVHFQNFSLDHLSFILKFFVPSLILKMTKTHLFTFI